MRLSYRDNDNMFKIHRVLDCKRNDLLYATSMRNRTGFMVDAPEGGDVAYRYARERFTLALLYLRIFLRMAEPDEELCWVCVVHRPRAYKHLERAYVEGYVPPDGVNTSASTYLSNRDARRDAGDEDFVRTSINGRSSVDSLSDSDLYGLIDSAIASGRSLGNPATINDLTPSTAWRITQDAVVKICHLSEPFMMSYISTRTPIPMPKVRRVLPVDRASTSACERHYLVMDYVEGDILAIAWPTMSWWARLRVIWYMRSYIRKLHKLPLPFPGVAGRVDASGKPCKNYGFYFTGHGAGPFESYNDMANFYDQRRFDHLVVAHRAYGVLVRGLPKFDRSQPLVVCHLDLHMNNIIVAPNGLSWLVDWGSSGMYPAWLEYASLAKWGDFGWHQAPKLWTWCARVMVGKL